MRKSKKVLCFVAYYLPGYKAGGPLKTIKNMIDHFEGDFEFSIVTRDRDLGDTDTYSSIKPNEWMGLDSSKALYLSPDNLTLKSLAKIISDTRFDILYLNSFFDVNLSIKPLIARRFGLIKPYPVVLAPRGEFSKGALALRPFKKKLYIKLSNCLGLYKHITWQASSEHEMIDILDALNIDASSVFIAKDLPEKKPTLSQVQDNLASSQIRLVFLSRISPMKNLDFALQVLSKVKNSLSFDIYGPIEDKAYWQACLKLIDALPEHIQVNYCGAVNPAQVSDIFSQYDLFFFPTRGENYGHVIAEALSVGTPVLMSDQTPWLRLSGDGLGWDLPLDSESVFIEKIEQVANMQIDERTTWRSEVMKKAVSRINSDKDIADNKALFEFALNHFKLK